MFLLSILNLVPDCPRKFLEVGIEQYKNDLHFTNFLLLDWHMQPPKHCKIIPCSLFSIFTEWNNYIILLFELQNMIRMTEYP